MAKYLKIVADTNDADYVTEETKIEDWVEANLDTILKVGRGVLKYGRENRYKHNWDDMDHSAAYLDTYEGVFSEEELGIFSEVCPFGQYGIHTIESIEIREVVTIEKL